MIRVFPFNCGTVPLDLANNFLKLTFSLPHLRSHLEPLDKGCHSSNGFVHNDNYKPCATRSIDRIDSLDVSRNIEEIHPLPLLSLVKPATPKSISSPFVSLSYPIFFNIVLLRKNGEVDLEGGLQLMLLAGCTPKSQYPYLKVMFLCFWYFSLNL